MITGSDFILFLDQLRGQEINKFQGYKSNQLFLAIPAQIKISLIDSLSVVCTEFPDSFVLEEVLGALNDNLKDIRLKISGASDTEVFYQQQFLLKATKQLIQDIKQYASL